MTALEAIGLAVTVLPALDGFPDAHFVEDAAILTPEVRILTRPGAASRRDEPDTLAPALEWPAGLERIVAPGTLDGGDVLFVGRRCFVGLSRRTNRSGAEQLARILEPHGYACRPVEVVEGLHLKSSVCAIDDATLIVTPSFADHPAFRRCRQIVTAEGEGDAANVLALGDRLLVPAGCPRTAARLRAAGHAILEVDIGEARCMDGGLTCLSLRF